MNTFCTIITANYYPYAAALYKSLRNYNEQVTLHVLIADNKTIDKHLALYPGIKLVTTQELSEDTAITELYSRYAYINIDFFRWAAKPLFLLHLLKKGYDKVIFVDCDIFFFNDYNFLFTELDSAGILLTPHWRSTNPLIDETGFIALFTNGIFNAGFIGSSQKGIPALQWWAEACHFKMGEVPAMGIHDDQKYLDAMPVLFETVKIVRHKGCNISSWNVIECRRKKINDNLLINGEYPIIFIHFSEILAKEILRGHDTLLLPYLIKYKTVFEEDGSKLSAFMSQLDTHLQPGILKKIKWKLKVRVRIKRFLYKLARSL